MMIHTNLFGQKEEMERKKFLIHDNIPTEIRQKVIYVFSENVFFGKRGGFTGRLITEDYHKLMYEVCKYKGIPCTSYASNDKEDAVNKLLLDCSIEDLFRVIELFIYIKKIDQNPGSQERLRHTIDDINEIFNFGKIGYEVVNERIIRKDSEFLQEQVIKKTINLLDTNDFKGPLEEFQKALDHYTRKEYKETIQEANNSFESTMKSVLTKRNISFNQDGPADLLLDVLCKNKIMNTYTKPMFMGLPKLRNNESAHGQGIDFKKVSQSYAELALNLAGSFIVFLINRYHELKP